MENTDSAVASSFGIDADFPAGAGLQRAAAVPPGKRSPLGQGWNTTALMSGNGISSVSWVSSLPNVQLASTIELPYANAGGQNVHAASARAWGKDLAGAIKAFGEQSSMHR